MKDKENSRQIQFKEELVRKAKNGDTKAFSLLYAGVCKEMYKFALYMMKHTEDAEDAVSETVISAFENIAKLKNESSFKSWIFTILGNQCRKMLGKSGNHASEEETPEAGHEPQWYPYGKKLGEDVVRGLRRTPHPAQHKGVLHQLHREPHHPRNWQHPAG